MRAPWKRGERKFNYCEPYEDTDRTLYTDQNGKPRIYYYLSGSNDSVVQRELYYDESGKLRFAFIIAGAHNGTKLEHRVFFSKVGKKVWEIQKRLEGPGYTFPTEWPDAELIQNPVQAFNDNSPCPETNWNQCITNVWSRRQENRGFCKILNILDCLGPLLTRSVGLPEKYQNET